MQEFILDEHSMFCRDKEYCTTFNKFIFYAYNNFFMVNYYPCMTHCEKYDFYQDIIFRVCNKAVIKNYSPVNQNFNNRGKYDQDLKSLRQDGKLLRKYLYDIHYTYSDNAGKMYCIYSEIPFFDKLCNNDELCIARNNAIKYIEEKKYDRHLIDQVCELFYDNEYMTDDRICLNTTDDLIKQINQFINQKSNTYAK
jgi:hypothetical protein